MVDRHISANETVDNLIDSKKNTQCIAINNPMNEYFKKQLEQYDFGIKTFYILLMDRMDLLVMEYQEIFMSFN